MKRRRIKRRMESAAAEKEKVGGGWREGLAEVERTRGVEETKREQGEECAREQDSRWLG